MTVTTEFKIWRGDFSEIFLGSRYKEICNNFPSEREIESWEAMAKSVFSDETLLDRFQCTLFLIAEGDEKMTYFYSPTELIELTLEKIRNDINNNIQLDKEAIHKHIGYLFNSIHRNTEKHDFNAQADEGKYYLTPYNR
jgi:hypothetical protein